MCDMELVNAENRMSSPSCPDPVFLFWMHDEPGQRAFYLAMTETGDLVTDELDPERNKEMAKA